MEPSSRVPSVNSAEVDWDLVDRSAFRIHQRFRYEYPAPISDSHHRLIVVPPVTFGAQSRTSYRLELSAPATILTLTDSFENTVLDVRASRIERMIEFVAHVTVERNASPANRFLPGAWLEDPRLLSPSRRTAPDAALRQAAAELGALEQPGLALAELANAWVFERLTYRAGVTSVRTTAAEALALGSGVCQDYAHVMLALCRLLGLPSLYVSGHLLGEGGTHAWVEVLLPAADGSPRAVAWPLDPTHGRRAGMSYVTVAVGREYGDVAPASGSYRAPHRGRLFARKRMLLTEVSYST